MLKCLIMLLILSSPMISFGRNLGVVGKTYPFIEKDALSEIEDRAKQVDWAKHMANLEGKLVKFRPKMQELPRVVANRVRLVDTTYTLDVDVPDPRDPSRVLYPKGFTFNPFQYMSLPGCIVFVDASDKKQLSWLSKSPYPKEVMTRILLTGGDVGQMEEVYGRPFFYADNMLVDRLGVMAVPSAACQKGVQIEVQEFLP